MPVLLYLLASLLLGTIFSQCHEARSVVSSFNSPELMLQGRAQTPFQYRDLVPLLVRLVAYLIGYPPRDHMPIFLLFDRTAAIGAFYAGFVLLRRIHANPAWILTMFAMMLANYAFGSTANYIDPFDLPALLLFTLGLVTLIDRHLIAFYVVLILGLLNRETAATLTLIFALEFYDLLPRRQLAAHLGAQLLLLASIKLTVWYVFRDNPGDGVASFGNSIGSRCAMNLHDLAHGKILPVFAGLYVPFIVSLPFITDRFVARALLIIPPFCLAMLVVANLVEFRVFTELIPLLMIAMANGLPEALRRYRAQYRLPG